MYNIVSRIWGYLNIYQGKSQASSVFLEICPNRVLLRVPLRVLLGLGFKGPCTQIVYMLAPKCLQRDYFKAKVCAAWAHGPLNLKPQILKLAPRTYAHRLIDHDHQLGSCRSGYTGKMGYIHICLSLGFRV